MYKYLHCPSICVISGFNRNYIYSRESLKRITSLDMSSVMNGVLPNTYQAAFFENKGEKLTLRSVRLQEPGPGYILVKVLASGICHTDRFLQQGMLGDLFPRVPGHEAVGDVVAVGKGVTRFKGGERVGAAWHGGKSHLATILVTAANAKYPRPRRIMPFVPTGNVPAMQQRSSQRRDNGWWLRGIRLATRRGSCPCASRRRPG